LTILIGLKTDVGVIIVGDKKTSGLSNSGEHVGTYHLTKKVNAIQQNMIMGTAGLDIGIDLRELIRKTLYLRENREIKESIKHIEDTLSYNYNSYRRLNEHSSYSELLALVGGYDREKKAAFLYEFSQLNGFKPTRIIKPFVIASPSNEITNVIHAHILEGIQDTDGMGETVEFLAKIIRSIDSPSVSKECFGILLFYFEKDDAFKCATYDIDNKGEVTNNYIK